MSKNCSNCDGACCKYVAMEIDCPEDLDDFENIKWFVLHKGVKVFVDEDDSWNIQFDSKCKYLSKENKCLIHEDYVENPPVSRPKICREFSVEECPFHNKYVEKFVFESIEDVEKYVKDIFLKKKTKY